ncbi:Uncharacterised protein [Mycobacteroides abscessus subsp. abscessus]|nr:Uncharacterised protein [Mycobacteroides abscessus subsp. abscessus]SHX44365.1 Uncharacterised protein [Mycobacteroides abscessus subsp. abscessus]SKV41338.1 Uncharacterised protein [Mycobacteroides abscessus subsp. abscessus]
MVITASVALGLAVGAKTDIRSSSSMVSCETTLTPDSLMASSNSASVISSLESSNPMLWASTWPRWL